MIHWPQSIYHILQMIKQPHWCKQTNKTGSLGGKFHSGQHIFTFTDTKQKLLTWTVQTGQTCETQGLQTDSKCLTNNHTTQQRKQLTTQTGSTQTQNRSSSCMQGFVSVHARLRRFLIPVHAAQLTVNQRRHWQDELWSFSTGEHQKQKSGIRLSLTGCRSCESEVSATKLNGSRLTLMTLGSDMLFKATLMLSHERTWRWNRMQLLNVCFHVLWAVYNFSITLNHPHQNCCWEQHE